MELETFKKNLVSLNEICVNEAEIEGEKVLEASLFINPEHRIWKPKQKVGNKIKVISNTTTQENPSECPEDDPLGLFSECGPQINPSENDPLGIFN